MNLHNVSASHANADSARRRRDAKLLVLTSSTAADRGNLGEVPAVVDANISDLSRLLERGDVLVVNDAATLPASLRGSNSRTGDSVELRLLAPTSCLECAPLLRAKARAFDEVSWFAVAFGAGDWRTPTECRPDLADLAVGDVLTFTGGLVATVRSMGSDGQPHQPPSARWLRVELSTTGATGMWRALYQSGAPIQYAYHRSALELWDVQTIFASRPTAIEPPSSAMHLSWELTFALQDRGVDVVSITHATGVSSTGDAVIDAMLPLPERYRIPRRTAAVVNAALADGRRVIAVGTGAMRALESAVAPSGELRAGSGVTSLKISGKHRRRVVSGLLTGMHDAGTSHLELLDSLVPRPRLEVAYGAAAARGFLWHEFGDLTLVLSRLPPAIDAGSRRLTEQNLLPIEPSSLRNRLNLRFRPMSTDRELSTSPPSSERPR